MSRIARPNTCKLLDMMEQGTLTDEAGNAITDFGNKLRQAEAVSIGGVKGTSSMQDVVEHVMSAEQSLQAVIAVRDKVISAYQEISRMAI